MSGMRRYVLTTVRGFRGRIAVSAAAGIVRVAAGLGFVALSKRAVDIATGAATGSMALCVAGLIGALVVELICSAVANRTTDRAEALMKNHIQERLYGRILASEWTGREAFHSGDVLSRLTEDSRVAAECLCRTVPTVVVALVQFAGAFVFLCWFSPLLAVTVTLIVPLFIGAARGFFRRTRVLTRRIRGIESRLQERMQESLQHRLLLLACGHTARTLEAIGGLLRARYRVVKRRTDVTVWSRTAVIAGFQSGYIAAFLWGIRGLRDGSITFGMMTAYLQLAGQIQRPLAELARLMPGLIQAHTAFARLEELEMLPAPGELPHCGIQPDGEPAGIAVRDVWFGYPGQGRMVLEGFSHTFTPGSRTAIIGETGAGKSTLLRLIAGLLKPRQGTIELLREDDPGEASGMPARGSIVYVPQGNSLLSGTIRSNLLIGKPDATEQEMLDALHTAAADFVAGLRLGLDTPCGEQGHGLSEGQAQRIAIARGLLRPGAILLLDEISASLDEATETLLMQRLMERAQGHTVLMVTHRPGVLPFCDTVLSLPTA